MKGQHNIQGILTDNLLRHNLDVMHIEKKFLWEHIQYCYESDGKNKRQWEGKRKDLELKVQDNGKILKPKANYTLTPDEAKSVCQWIKELKMPDGYSSNLARFANVEKGRIMEWKVMIAMYSWSHYFLLHLVLCPFMF